MAHTRMGRKPNASQGYFLGSLFPEHHEKRAALKQETQGLFYYYHPHFITTKGILMPTPVWIVIGCVGTALAVGLLYHILCWIDPANADEDDY